MAYLARVPRNEDVIREFGPYPSRLDVGDGTTENQRNARRGLRGFEPHTQAALLTLVQLADRHPVDFFDVGAHIGMHSLLVASVYPPDRVRVTGFEPTPRTLSIFRSLAGANQLQIRIEPVAVSDEEGTVELFISPWESSNSLMAGFRPAKDTLTVPVVTLDSYCARTGARPAVIKIDVETYESHVLAGGIETLRRDKPSIVCEILAVTEPEATRRTVDMLDSIGYRMHRWTLDHGWVACTPDDIVAGIDHVGNDWLFTPFDLDDRFARALETWRAAIAEGTPETTITAERSELRRQSPFHEIEPAAKPRSLAARLSRPSASLPTP